MNETLKKIIGYVIFGLYQLIKYITIILPILKKAYTLLLNADNLIKVNELKEPKKIKQKKLYDIFKK